MKLILGLIIVTLFVCYANAGKKEKVHIKIIVPKLIKTEKHTKTVYIHKHDKKKDDDHGHKDDQKQHHVVHHYHYHKAQHDHKGSQKHYHDLKHDHKHKGSHEHKGHLGHDHKGKFSHDNKGKLSHSHSSVNKKKEDDHGHGHGHGHGGHKSHKLLYVDNFNHDEDHRGEYNQYDDHSRDDNLDKDNYYLHNNKPNLTPFFDSPNDKLSHKSLRPELVEVSNFGNPNRIFFNHDAESPLSKLLTATSGYQVEEHQPHDFTTKTYNHLSQYSDASEDGRFSSDGEFEESRGYGRTLDGGDNSDEGHFRKVDDLVGGDAESGESQLVKTKLSRFGFRKKA